MIANDLKPPKGARHPRKRVGRGNASGHGTYSTRGLKGQKSRSGKPVRRGFEGGQTPLVKRLPKRRGFTNKFRVDYKEINLRDLNAFEKGAEVTPELLKERGLISNLRKPVKILGDGELTLPLTVHAHKFSQSAKERIEAAGGKAVEINNGSGD
ncbi:MAG TPA: 50S ribosomal protein L15 [Dehalococcoidia bacterium]|nr:50S ribosomal protein L15 [Dehalococcoidia bacterium]